MKIYLLLFLLCGWKQFNVGVTEVSGNDNEDTAHKVIENSKLVLRRTEQFVSKAARWTRKHTKTVKAAAAGTTLLYGGRYPHSALLFQTLRVTAGDSLKQAASTLADDYSKMRAAVEACQVSVEDVPHHLARYNEEMNEIQTQMREAKKAMKSGTMSKEEFQDLVAKSSERSAAIHAATQEITGLINSMNAAFSAVDADSVKRLLSEIFSALTSCVATATSRTAAMFTIGFGVAQEAFTDIKRFVLPVMERLKGNVHHEISMLPPASRKWAEFAVSGLASFLGIAAAYFMQRGIIMFSMCYLASEYLLSLALEQFSALTETPALAGLPPMSAHSPLVSPVHVSLTMGFFLLQIQNSVPMPLPLRIVLAPLTALEKYLQSLTIHKLMPWS